MDNFTREVKNFVTELEKYGIKIIDEKPINYGLKLKAKDGADICAVNIYNGKKGVTFVVQGKETPLKNMLENIAGKENLPANFKDPKIPVIKSETEFAEKPSAQNRPSGFENIKDFDYKWIGIDESGKGDFFGPLAAAAVMVDKTTANRLETLGVKDSKKISDKKNSQIAAQIKGICADRYAIFKLSPKEYNKTYCQYETKGKNLNHLLGYIHAATLEELLEKEPCSFALADKFGKEEFTQGELLTKGREIVFVQLTHAEQNIAVAAASILARDVFLETMKSLSEEFDMPFPKGAVNVLDAARLFVKKHGKPSLSLVCKTHFRTYSQIF
jgi:ribonuclease HIII